MKRSTLIVVLAMCAIATCGAFVTAPAARAHGELAVSGYAGVRVWVNGGDTSDDYDDYGYDDGDMFDDYDDVNVCVRADRDCYVTLLLVDTAGYVHVLYPTSPYERAWMRGKHTYRYRGCDLGLGRLDGVGVAHLYAVASPVPFDYSAYGVSVFVGGFGFRVFGDPYAACRDFYASLLPASCRWDFVGVSCARFYVHEWVRYPSYLCSAGPGFHVRIGDGCRECGPVYASYRNHVVNPREALRPTPVRFKSTHGSRVHGTESSGRVAPARTRGTLRVADSQPKHVERVKVVSTSRARTVARSANVKHSEPRFKNGEVSRTRVSASRTVTTADSRASGRSGVARAKATAHKEGVKKVRRVR